MKKILIVEDNIKLLESMATLFEDYFKVIIAENGKEGIQAARLHQPEIIISDILMPEANGFELARELKKSKETDQIPIILLTALGEDEKKIDGYNAGADAYIVKPFKFDVLLARVNNILENREKIKSAFNNHFPNYSELDYRNYLLSQLESMLVHYYKYKNVNIPEMASMLNMKTNRLEREIREFTGMTPVQYLNDYKLTQAKIILEKEKKSVFEVSHMLGFKSVSYFGKIYRAKFGIAPSKSRKK